jgi:2-C-methyl-D-erythritol 4-phosphate cytidylyltransferase
VELHPGGATRQETVGLLLDRCTEDLVVVHDAARPFISRDLVLEVMAAAREAGAAAAVAPVHLPIARREGGVVRRVLPATEAGLAHTPQAYRRDLLTRAYRQARATGSEDPSALQLVLRLGHPVRLVPCDERNIKITTRLDWEIARTVIAPGFRSAD